MVAAGAIDPRVALFFALVTLVAIAGSVYNSPPEPSEGQSHLSIQETPTAGPTASDIERENTRSTATPLPAEYLANQQQTIGLTLAAAALVLVVVIGVLSAFIQNPGDS